MADKTKRKKWSDVKARLEAFDRKGLVSLLRRRDIPRPVQQAPGQRPRRSRSHRRVPPLNGRCIRDRRPHADVRGGGNGASRGSGHGDEAYFDALQIRLDAVAKEFDTLPADARAKVRARLGRIQVRAQDVGWGFSDAVDEVLHALDARAVKVRPGKVDRR